METECPTCYGTGETPARTYLHEKVSTLLMGVAYVDEKDRNRYTELTTGLAGRAPDAISGHDGLDRHNAIIKIITAAGLDPKTWGVCPECRGDGFKL